MNNLRGAVWILLFVIILIFPVTGEEISIQDEITRTKLTISSLKAQLNKIEEKISSAESEILRSREITPSPLIDEYKSKIVEYRTELKEQLLTYRERHPVIKKLNARVEYYEQKLETELDNTSEKKVYSKNPELLELTAKRNDLETSLSGYEAVYQSLILLKKSSEEKNVVSSDKDEQEKSPVMKEETGQQEVAGPFLKNIPVKKIFLSIVLVLSVIVLILLISFFYNGNRRKPGNSDNENSILGKLRRVKTSSGSKDIAEDVVVYHTPDTSLRSDIREIINSFEKSSKTICISSQKKGTGKTFLAANMGAFLAMGGNKVLLIDSNFETPRVHRVFLTDNESGFSDVLLGENVDNVIKSTAVSNLDIITAGHDPLTGAEILDSTSFLDFVRNMEERYDKVIIDSSSISQDDYALVAGKYYPVAAVCSTVKEAVSFEETALEKNIVYSGAVLREG